MTLAKLVTVQRDPVTRFVLKNGTYIEFINPKDGEAWQEAMNDYWRAGAEAMRERAAKVCDGISYAHTKMRMDGTSAECADAIRDLPVDSPTSSTPQSP